jgi:hypothetical protein
MGKPREPPYRDSRERETTAENELNTAPLTLNDRIGE